MNARLWIQSIHLTIFWINLSPSLRQLSTFIFQQLLLFLRWEIGEIIQNRNVFLSNSKKTLKGGEVKGYELERRRSCGNLNFKLKAVLLQQEEDGHILLISIVFFNLQSFKFNVWTLSQILSQILS